MLKVANKPLKNDETTTFLFGNLMKFDKVKEIVTKESNCEGLLEDFKLHRNHNDDTTIPRIWHSILCNV